MIKIRCLSIALLMLAAVQLSGCSMGAEVASGLGTIASASIGTVASHIDHVSVTVDPHTGAITGSLVFKNGRWVREPLAVSDARDVDRCVEPVRAIEAPAREVIDYRALVGFRDEMRGGLSSRAISRGVARAAKDLREEENDRHAAEKKRLDTIIYATSQTTVGRFRRAIGGTPCSLPIAATVPVSTVQDAPVFSPVQIPEPTQPAPNAELLPESGTMKGLSNLEARVSALEVARRSDSAKLDEILAAIKGKP